jgi:hypothetical protein
LAIGYPYVLQMLIGRQTVVEQYAYRVFYGVFYGHRVVYAIDVDFAGKA